MMKVTRDVIVDMWPIYAAREASADTCALIEEFLQGDPELASRLKRGPDVAALPVSLPPDAEARAFAQTRALAHQREWLHAARVLALVFTAMLVIRAFSDTPEDRTGRIVLAVAAWAIYGTLWYWLRRRAMRATTPRKER